MATSTVQAVPKLYDVIMWLMGRVERFPRSQKFTLGDRIVNLSLDTLDLLIEATYTRKRSGEFQMGSNDTESDNDEQPVHTVYIDALNQKLDMDFHRII